MAAEDHLGNQFFHGTAADLKPGDLVRPGAEMGISHHPQVQRWRNQHVWATAHEAGAWWYAHLAELSSGSHSPYQSAVGNRPRGRVVEIEPVGNVRHYRRLSRAEPKEFAMGAARVKRVIDTPPFKQEGLIYDEQRTAEPVQGELPLNKSWKNWDTTVKFKGDDDSEAPLARHWEWSRRTFPERWEGQ